MLHHPMAAAPPGPGAVQGRPLTVITADVLTVFCPACAASPTVPCRIAGPAGNHLARFAAAARSGLIPMADMEAALAAAEPVFTGLTLIAGGAVRTITWLRTAERSTWAAEAPGAVLHVSRSVAGGWRAAVEWTAPGVRAEKFSDTLPTRRAAQVWAERTAGAR